MKLKVNNAEVQRRYRQVTTCTGYALKEEFAGVAINPLQLAVCLVLAVVLLAVTFIIQPFNFWLCIAITTLILGGLALLLGGNTIEKRHLDLEAVFWGIGAAVLLYLFFRAANWLLHLPLFSILSVDSYLMALYSLKETAPIYLIIPVLILITSPGEEIFWRGFVQRGLMQSFGQTKGWLFAASLYALVHVVSLNPLLVMAAFVSGLFWGWMYQKQRHIVSCITCHILWALAIFIVFPLAQFDQVHLALIRAFM